MIYSPVVSHEFEFKMQCLTKIKKKETFIGRLCIPLMKTDLSNWYQFNRGSKIVAQILLSFHFIKIETIPDLIESNEYKTAVQLNFAESSFFNHQYKPVESPDSFDTDYEKELEASKFLNDTSLSLDCDSDKELGIANLNLSDNTRSIVSSFKYTDEGKKFLKKIASIEECKHSQL